MNDSSTATQLRPVVVIPLYRRPESPVERLSLHLALKVLHRHPIAAAIPESLQDPGYWHRLGFSQVEVFEDRHFASVAAYNGLMLDPRFYRRYADYSHVLLCQTDALVFSDQLLQWCAQPYDYVGPPWAYPWSYGAPAVAIVKRLRSRLYRALDRRASGPAQLRWCAERVGNGGFSLRRVRAFMEVLDDPPDLLHRYREHGLPDYPEDFFWGIDVNRERPRLRVPDWRTALGFGVESAPPQALRLLGRLPFGAHAWDRGYMPYWLEVLRSAPAGAGLPSQLFTELESASAARTASVSA